MDTRGNLAAFFSIYFEKHPRATKEFVLKTKPNLKYDIQYIDNGVTKALIELKYKDDLIVSLKNRRLMRELQDYTIEGLELNKKVKIYLVCGGEYPPHIYAWLVGLMNSEFPWVRFYMPMSREKMIEKVLSILKNDVDKVELVKPPFLVRNSKKDFTLSIASLMNGISEGLANEIAGYWYDDITESEISEIVKNYYNDDKEYGELPYKIYTKVHETWLKKKQN